MKIVGNQPGNRPKPILMCSTAGKYKITRAFDRHRERVLQPHFEILSDFPLLFQIVNKQDNEDIWEPPMTQTDVIDSREYKITECLIEIACKNTSPVMRKNATTFSFRNREERQEFDELVRSSLYLKQGKGRLQNKTAC